MAHCIVNNIISNIQHGFLIGKSTITNLLKLSNDFTKQRDNSNNVDIICIYFAKAFDTVPYKQLIYKLSQYGIKGNLLTWIFDYLNLCKTYTCIKEKILMYTDD